MTKDLDEFIDDMKKHAYLIFNMFKGGGTQKYLDLSYEDLKELYTPDTINKYLIKDINNAIILIFYKDERIQINRLTFHR